MEFNFKNPFVREILSSGIRIVKTGSICNVLDEKNKKVALSKASFTNL